ncbi:MAG TPA: chemotaxis protein CheW [Desulfobacteraceae bacterium]|nr:chemotaxis protein CheW [Desulfobacteraceae bacterium]|tara:strand:+ start:466 stop:957 length:492 start_codon:yes stop_codon:yes gene_type:complete
MKDKTNAPADAGISALGGKYLTFVLNREDYGIDIHRIKEIIGMMDITTVPRTPAHIKGVINLRGKVIPVIDLRIRFSMPAQDYTDKTCIVVVEMDQDGTTLLLGMVVDSVSEVLTVPGEAVGPPPAFGAAVTTDWILGLAKMDSGVKILLDIEAVVGDTNLTA